jgi:hypothetical protein
MNKVKFVLTQLSNVYVFWTYTVNPAHVVTCTKPSEQEFVHKEEDFDSLIGNVNPNIKQHAPQV